MRPLRLWRITWARLHVVGVPLSRCCCGQAVQLGITETSKGQRPKARSVAIHLASQMKINTLNHFTPPFTNSKLQGLIRMERKGKTSICTLRPEGLEAVADHLKSLAAGGNKIACCVAEPSSCCA